MGEVTYNATPAVPGETYDAERNEHAHFLRELQDVACLLEAEGYKHSAATVRRALAALK